MKATTFKILYRGMNLKMSKRGGTTGDRAEALNTGWHARSLTLARPPRFFRLASILLKRLMYRYAQPPVCSASLRNTGRKTYFYEL